MIVTLRAPYRFECGRVIGDAVLASVEFDATECLFSEALLDVPEHAELASARWTDEGDGEHHCWEYDEDFGWRVCAVAEVAS